MIDKTRIDKPLFFNGQSMKDLKKTTPCSQFVKNDKVKLDNVKSILPINQHIVLNGIYTFDSYDSYDNTVYVYCDKHKLFINVLYSDLIYIEKKKKNG